MKRRRGRRRKSGRPRRRAPRELRLESLEDRMLLAQLVGVQTPDGQLLGDGDVLNIAPRELTLRFEESLDPDSLQDEIVVSRSGSDGTFSDGNEVVIQPGFVGVGDLPNEAIFRFAESQPDDRYRIDILGVTPSQIDFQLNLGAQVVAVVPQPITRIPITGALEQARDQIVVHFNDDDLLDDATSAENPEFYQLIFTNDTVSNTDDVVHTPASVDYDPSSDTAVLTFASDLDELSTGAGTYRLRIGSDDALPAPPQIIEVAPDGVVLDSEFDIEVRFLDDTLSPSQQALFTLAADRWSEVIVGDLPNVGFVDDVLIFASGPRIDGPGNILGQAGPRGVRLDALPFLGNMEFDSADLVTLEASGGLFDVIMHEMGHVLGIGTLWDDFGLLVGAGTTNPRFIGQGAIDEYNAIFGLTESSVPVENMGGAGTRDSHWRESVFRNELMTGFLNSGPNPLSRITVGSLADMGYDVNLDAADEYLPPGGAGAAQGATANGGTANQILAVEYELMVVDPNDVPASLQALEEEAGGPGSTFNTAMSVGFTDLSLQVLGDGSVFGDGQTITLVDAQSAQHVFELNDPAVDASVTPGALPIEFDSGTTAAPTSQEEMVQAIADAINVAAIQGINAGVAGHNVTLTGVDDVMLGAGLAGASVGRLNSLIISSSIDPEIFPLDFPGADDEPGHRDIPVQSHLIPVPPQADPADFDQSDRHPGISTISYNFKDVYGTDPEGRELRNLITPAQEQRAREIFEIYADLLGVQFIETESDGMTIATGDLRALSPGVPTGPGGVLGIAGGFLAIMDNAESWNDESVAVHNPPQFSWFDTAMHEIGHLLGLGHTHELAPFTVMGDEPLLDFTNTAEPVFPGDHDIVHGRHVHRPEANDIDLYRFDIQDSGMFTAETIAERRVDVSLLDSALNLYRQRADGSRELMARNDDYFSEDSYIEMRLGPGTYFIGVSASGNLDYDPTIEDSGFGGTSDGPYDLRMTFRPDVDNSIVDADRTGGALAPTRLDGDADGVPGGNFNFWFRVATPGQTRFVDKSHTPTAGTVGSLANPYNNLANAMAAAQPGEIVRVVGNGGIDGDLTTLGDNLAYQIGFNSLGQALPDGPRLNVPQGVTLMVDAGAIFKLRRTRIGVGSSSLSVDRSESALQVLGTPQQSVFFTSFNDEQIGVDTNPNLAQTPLPGDWGGLVIRNDLDNAEGRFNLEDQGAFLNYVNHADIRFGGGNVVIDSVSQVVTPIHLTDARATVTFNTITLSADAAISANPDSFAETNFHAPSDQSTPFTSYYARVGPDIHGNDVRGNSINGLFIRIRTPAGNQLQKLTVPGRFNDTDIVHVLLENLRIEGTPGGAVRDSAGRLQSRFDAQLVIDPTIVVKLDNARVETGFGAQLVAEGLAGGQVIFTSLFDDRFGAGSTFDTAGDGSDNMPNPGDWGGLYIGHASTASLDNVQLAFGGGLTRIEGSFTNFNPVEVHQAEARITNSVFEDNAAGFGGQSSANRGGRGPNAEATIFVRGAQPIIVGNIFRDNAAAVININANSLNHFYVADYGRNTGSVQRLDVPPGNQGPLVQDNMLVNNGINGMVVRGATLTTEGVWDDTDIVHVVREEIVIPDFHTFGGLRLESSPEESLIVKLSGPNAGFRATGGPLQFGATTLAGDIDDRIGGILQVIGQPGRSVVLTSLADDQVGAGFQPNGVPQTDTNNDGPLMLPQRGDWQGVTLETYAHDRNVAVVIESESPGAVAPGVNASTDTAQFVGELAPHEKAGDDIRRLGFEIHGQLNRKNDVDVYSFRAVSGTEVWLDIDRTTTTLDSVIELVDANGSVLARSDNSYAEQQGTEERFADPAVFEMSDVRQEVGGLIKSTFLSKDHWTVNRLDAGMRLVLPGTPGTTTTYHVRVRSSSDDLDGNLLGGRTSGAYQLQIRLREIDELPGSTVQFADIGFAVNGIEAIGQPIHSPLLGEASESEGFFPVNDDFTTAQPLGNVLTTDRAALSVAGNLGYDGDVDWYQFDVDYESVQLPGGFASITFDIDYADGFANADTRLSVYREDPDTELLELVLSASASNIFDDRPAPLNGADVDDLSRGSVGAQDPFIGPIELSVGSYYVAVSAENVLPQVLDQFTEANPVDALARLEPIDSLVRTADEHFDPNADTNKAVSSDPLVPLLFQVGDSSGPVPFHLGDVVLFVSKPNGLETVIHTVDPFTGAQETEVGAFDARVGDIMMRSDGRLYTLTRGTDDGDSGNLLEINTGDASATLIIDDMIATFQQQLDEMGVPTGECEASDVGMQFDAMTIGPPESGFTFLAAGSRTDGLPMDPDGFSDNALYTLAGPFFEALGQPIPFGIGFPPNIFGGDRCVGAGTDVIELGQIDTSLGRGGQVKGLALIQEALTPGGDLEFNQYAVDNAGGLYRVSGGGGLFGAPMTTEYVDVNGNLTGIRFEGLTAGPSEVEGGRYAQTLFGIDDEGVIHAFDTAGNLLPIFVDGTTSIETGISDPHGLAFSNLQRNLWHLSDHDGRSVNRDGHERDPGHGFEMPVTQSREQSGDSPTYYFGNDNDPFAQNNQTGNQSGFDVNYPGGAHGSLISKTFSLADYAPDDQPTLYFNYFLDTEDAVYVPGAPTPMRDSFRVFVSDDSDPFLRGQWNLVATNNSRRDPANNAPLQVCRLFPDTCDEFDNPFGVPNNAANFGTIQELFDSRFDDVVADPFTFKETLTAGTGTWRQARVPLNAFAGSDSLRLRFDFSTAGSMNLGHSFTTGSELRAVVASELRDGDSLDIFPARFEIDLGVTLVLPTGAAVADGETLTIDDGLAAMPVTFEFDTNGEVTEPNTPIVISGAETAKELGEKVEQALADSDLFRRFTVIVPDGAVLQDGETVTITDETGATAAFEFDDPSSLFTAGVGSGNIAIEFTVDMQASEIAASLEQAIADSGLTGLTTTLGGVDGNRLLIEGAVSVVHTPVGSSFNPIATVEVEDAMHLVGNRLNLEGSVTVMQSDSPGVVAEGSVGVDFGSAVTIHSEMTAKEVADAIALAMADTFAGGVTDVIKRFGDTVKVIGHQVFDPGPFGVADLLPADQFGAFFDGAPQTNDMGSPRGLDNRHEGVYIDDVVIGFAERGEMVTYVEDGAGLGNTQFVDNVAVRPFGIREGEYQLEIRGGAEYGFTGFSPPLNLFRSFDTNDRLSQDFKIFAPAGYDVAPGQFFTISDGIDRVTFEYVALNTGTGPTGSHVPIFFDPSDDATVMAGRIRDIINGGEVQETLQVDIAAGGIPSSNVVELSGEVVLVDVLPLGGLGLMPDPVERTRIEGRRFNEIGDENRFRDQGQLLIESTRIRNSQRYGIVVDASPRDLQTGNPHQGSPRNLREVNIERLAPGVTIKNNIISGGSQGGIHFSGDTDFFFDPAAAVPFGRIVNNTLFGRGGNLFPQAGSDVGIRVDENASPTVLNNIVANFETGVDIDFSSSSTVLGGTLYQGNDLDSSTGPGDFPIQLNTFDPLFVNLFAGNFYLTADAAAIDSSVDSIEDRPAMVTVRNPLGIPVSPILAPERDFRGQLRVDDPNVDTPAGVGANVFKDRGALDRADFSGPSAVLVTPRDNDAVGNDQNPAPTIVQSQNALLTNFSIQINDGIEPSDPGTGVADSTVVGRTVTLTRNGAPLTPTIDYRFTYNTTNDIMRLTPTTGVWPSNSTYVLTLDNSVETGIKDMAGNPLNGNQLDGTTQFTIVLGPARDYGDAPDPTYPTLSASGGPSHVLGSGLILGTAVDPESDGQPTAAADGDGPDDDGVVFAGPLIVNADVPLTVTASSAGLLDAWIDFTGDGDFNDPGEKVFSSEPLVGGANSLSVSIPSFAALGTTYGRFRLSTAGGLLPGGAAEDGEVEDYAFLIEGNPWQNASNRLDVDGNGEVEPLDALIIFNEINASGPGPLPIPPDSPPPPFLDVDGNGMVEPLDALIIINALNVPESSASQPFVQASVHAGEPVEAPNVGGDLRGPQFSVGGHLRGPQFDIRASGSLRTPQIDPGHLRIAADDYFQQVGRLTDLESSRVITEPLDPPASVGGDLRETQIETRVGETRRTPHSGSSRAIDRSAVDRTAWQVDDGVLAEIAADVREGWEVKRLT